MRGYSWGVALEYFHHDWAVRAGRFIQPKEPNQLPLDPKIFFHYGDQIETEHAHVLRMTGPGTTVIQEVSSERRLFGPVRPFAMT